MVFSVELTDLLDLDLSFTWDHNQSPERREDGTIPEQDDYRTSIGLGIEFCVHGWSAKELSRLFLAISVNPRYQQIRVGFWAPAQTQSRSLVLNPETVEW